jgi:dCTP diphosphatase
MKKSLEIEKMKHFFRHFAREREWECFHKPKNLAIALAVEAAELMEIFQWLGEDQSLHVKNDPQKLQAVKDEVADVFIYLLRLTDCLEIDLSSAFWEKMEKNRKKYPPAKCKKLASKLRNF